MVNLDERELLILKEFADRFSVRDVDHMKQILIDDDYGRRFWRAVRRWGGWIGGGIVFAFTIRDWIIWLVKKVLT